MSYHQVLNIGEDAIQVTVEYSMDDDTYAVVDRIILQGGQEVPVGLFDLPQIESIASTLEAGHHEVLREMDWQHKADMAEDRDHFRETYRDHPLGI